MTSPHTPEQLSDLLYRYDPIGLRAHSAPPNEYLPEAETIAPRLHEASSVADAKRIIHEEFTSWFTAEIAGDADRYTEIALELRDVPAT